MNDSRDAIERQIRDACACGAHDHAATLALDTYGREVQTFLIARLGEQRANDVFSDFLEDFWRGLPNFGWRSTLRSWAYTVARHAAARHLRNAHRKRGQLGISTAGVSALAELVRTQTAEHFKSEVKDRVRELRARLPEDDQTLLMLRIDRKLSFRELALVMSEQDAPPGENEIDTIAARLRQRFQAAKDRLRRLAEEEGLLGAHDD